MSREWLYFITGAVAVLLPLLIFAVIRKYDFFAVSPDAVEHYANDGRELALNIFHSRTAGDSPAPALLLFHGGGWRYGSPRQFYPQCRYFADAGITCISAAYRLGPVHAPDIQGAIADAGAALDYLRDNHKKLGIDAAAIFAGGGSSGGHLAAALGTGLHGQHRSRPAALLLLNPVLDLAPCMPANYLAGEQWQRISPMQHVEGNLPATLILSGSKDREVTPAMVERFCRAAEAAGASCTARIYPGQAHGFFNYNEGTNPAFDDTNRAMLNFINEQTKRRQQQPERAQ